TKDRAARIVAHVVAHEARGAVGFFTVSFQCQQTEGGSSASSSRSSPSPSPRSPGADVLGAGTTTFLVLASLISPFGPAIWPRILEGFAGSSGLARGSWGSCRKIIRGICFFCSVLAST